MLAAPVSWISATTLTHIRPHASPVLEWLRPPIGLRVLRRSSLERVLLPFTIWGMILCAGALLLIGRYDWNIDGGFYAKRGFVLSLYLFVIMLPTVYYLTAQTLHSRRVATGLTTVVFVVFVLPYRWLGLGHLFYYATHPAAYYPYGFPAVPGATFVPVRFTPTLQFLPGGALGTFRLDWLFMPVLFAIGTACVWGIWRVRAHAGFRTASRIPQLLTIAFAVICAQAFLHSGMRAPYTYDSVFVQPKAQQHWYLVYHFRHESGATEGDQYTYTPLEDYFQGAAQGGYNGLIRRPFGFYVESQISYFVNNFYGWLALNCLFWLAAVFATARLVSRLVNPRAGLIAGALVLVGPGFIAFVATPSMYMQNYATAAIALCAFEDLVAGPSDRGRPRFVLFAGVLALCALVYDLEPMFLVILVYGLSRRVHWRPLIIALVGAFLLLEGFTFVVAHGLHIAIDDSNYAQQSLALKATLHLITHPSLPLWYTTLVSVVPSFVRLWLEAFFVVPALIAVFGWRCLPDRSVKVLVAALFLMGFAIIATLQIGHQGIGILPRLVYPSFVGVCLPAAAGLDAVAERARGCMRVGVRRLGVATPWIVVAVMAVLVNIDTFGYPTMYEEFFNGTPPVWLPQ
jgi:hypothetical protein